MDFTLDENLVAVRDLAAEILADHATQDRVREIEATDDRIDSGLWLALSDAGLLGVALPEDHGGAGLGVGALCVLLTEQGRVVAPAPLWPAIVAGLAVTANGTPQTRAELLPGIADGSLRPTVALEEFAPADPELPGCRAEPDGDRWRLTGTKAAVPAARGADTVLVAAGTGSGAGLFLVAPDAPGTGWEWADTTSRDLAGNLHLDGAPAVALGEPGSGVLEWTVRHAAVAIAALQLGVAEGALAHAASYLKERSQFGRPLGSFQAVQHQLADCYIEIDAMRVTLWQAVSDLECGERDGRAALVARWWASESGLNVVHRVQHVHGGIGVDVDYPVHRHFLWGKQLAGTLGGAEAALADLGDILATREVSV